MPELPEVEVFRRLIEARVLRRKISRVETACPRVFKDGAERPIKALRGQSFRSVQRHGKYLFMSLGPGKPCVVLHFGLSGTLEFESGAGGVEAGHRCLSLELGRGSRLVYRDPRTFGQIWMVESREAFIRKKKLGPDMLSISKQEFVSRLAKKGGAIKIVLMDQSVVAGIGNTYSDEILFQAGIHPLTKTTRLNRKDLERLYVTSRKVLETALARGAEPTRFPEGYLLKARRAHAPCPRGRGVIERIAVGGRSAYYCTVCQKPT